MRDREGFTLIELLAVIVILGILAVITVPIVSNYINDSRDKTYKAHEATMKEAARSLTVECVNGNEICDLPKEGNSADIYLNELIDKNFSQRLQNPQGNGYCNENLSYVTITKVSANDYEYSVCLYCGNYVTDEVCAPIEANGDKTTPTCGTVEGESSEWTNKPRTISVGCTDSGSGCTRSKFSKTFKTTTVTGEILISDRAGNAKKCPVNVRVDTNAPTCELEVEGATTEINGWVSGPVKVRFKSGSRKDSESGINTWGIGTSMENPNYDRKESIDLTNINGVVTVFGYVKDNAGNEGTCSVNLRTGVQRPDFDIYYGYQIFPLKEDYTASNITVTNNVIKTTSTNPTITFSDMSKYSNANRVIITTENAITNPYTYTLTVGGATVKPRAMNGNRRLEYDITPGTYNTYVFKMGDKSNITETINRIEIQQTKNNLPTNKEVTVNLHPVLSREKVKTTGFSFDNGTHFQNDYYKSFVVTNGEVNGISQTKNDIPMYSDKKNYKILNGDKSGPTIDVTKSPDSWTNQDVTLTGTGQDSASGIVAYGFRKSQTIPYDSSYWNTISLTKNQISKTYTVGTIGTYYFNLKDEAGNLSNKAIVVDNIDKIKPECNVTGNSTIKCTDSGSTDYAVSSIGCYIYGKDATTSSTCKSVTATDNLNVTATVNATGTWNLYAKDRAGNISDKKSYVYYSVTYDKNGGSSCTKTSDIVRSGEKVDLTPTCDRRGYTFNGWSLDGSAITSHNISKNITLKARWTVNTYDISYEYNSGTAPSSGVPNRYTYGVGATINGKPTRSNYTFNGWSDNSSLSSPAFTKTIGTDEIGNKKYYAKWCQNCASVSHGLCSLNASTAGTCKYTTSCDEGYTISDNGTYNPKCTANTYIVTYNKGSGTGAEQTQSVTFDSAWTTKGAIFTKVGHNHVGWSTTNGGSKTHNLNTNQGAYKRVGNLTLYAVYEVATYNIYYEYNSGSAPSSGVPSTYTYGIGATINGKPTRSNYTFNGWSFNSNLSSAAFSKSIGTSETGNKTLYAKWCRNCNAGTHASCTLNASTAGTCSYTTSCSSGYTISGNGTYNPTCTPNTYTVTYNKGSGSGTNQTQSVTFGSNWTTKGAIFTKTGHNQIGWSTSNGGGRTHSLNTSQGAYNNVGNLTLYAVYEPATYNIYYEYNGGSAPSSGVPSTYTYGYGATINGRPTRYNYTFNGWSFSSSLYSPAFTKYIGATETGNQTLYAKWCRDCSPGSNASCTLNASSAGTCSYTTSCPSGYTINGNGTYNPTCTPNTYTVTYYANNGTSSSSYDTVTTGEYWYTKGKIFSRSNYILKGWSTLSYGGVTYNLNTRQNPISSNLSLYAVWGEPNCKIMLGDIKDDGHNANQLISVMNVCGWYNGETYPWDGGIGARTTSYAVPVTSAKATVNGCLRDRTNENTEYNANVPWLHWLRINCEDGSTYTYQREHGVKNFSLQ